MGGDGNHGLNSKTRILIETWILDAFKFFKKNNLDRIGVIEIQRYIEEYGVVPLKLTDMKYRKGNLSIGARRLSRFLITLSMMNKVIHIPHTSLWKRINEGKEIEEVYVPKSKYCSKCNTLLTPQNKVGRNQRSLICKPCFLKKRREYTHLPHVKKTNKNKHKGYYDTHREQELLRCKNYRKTHKEETRLRANNYYAKNKKKICAKIRERYVIKHRKMILPYKVKVCKNCGEIAMAKELSTNKDVCPICDSRIFEEVVITKDTKVHCDYCKREATIEEVLKQWIDIPFFNIKTLSYYDGCRGWD